MTNWQPSTKQCEWMARGLNLGVIVLVVTSWWHESLAYLAVSLALIIVLIERTWRRQAEKRELAERLPALLAKRFTLVNGHWYEWRDGRDEPLPTSEGGV